MKSSAGKNQQEQKVESVVKPMVEELPHPPGPVTETRRAALQKLAYAGGMAFLLPVMTRLFDPAGAAPFSQTDPTQFDWRFCDKCLAIFYNGTPNKGRCPKGGGHNPQGFNFTLPFSNLPDALSIQAGWRFCDKCFEMFWDGVPDKGHCAAGGGHHAQGFLFRLPHDIDETYGQGGWRYCRKCHAMFYDSLPDKGVCPAGGGHIALGFMFVLPHKADFIASIVEAHFHGDIVTPKGTALGGFVDLTLRSDGTYKAHFHMHDSGVPDYDFQVHALFVAGNGLIFALQHSGHVEGTDSTTLTHGPHRSNEQDVEGSHPFIKDNWPAVQAGHLAVSKEYSATGVIGFVQDAVKVVLDITRGAASGAAGAVIGLGDEMVHAFNSLKLGGDFGIIGGVVVFAAGGGLVLAVTTGVEAGAVTSALIKQRPLRGDEAGFAARVFGGTLPPADKIILTNLEGVGGRAFTIPGGQNIYVNIGSDALDHPTTHTDKFYPVPGQLLIHELTHAWQIHHATFVPGWVCSGVINQVGNTLGDSAYQYDPPLSSTSNWGDFNLEQQGAIVDQWFAGLRFGRKTAMDTNDPYFRFIRDNIRAGRT